MKNRCYNRRLKGYRRYGGRGITVCDSWKKSFQLFLQDMGRCPPGLTLERIDNDGNYEQNNCRWVTLYEQYRNRVNNVFLNYEGTVITQGDFAIRLGVNRRTIWKWRIQGMLEEDMIRRASEIRSVL